jgi:hypothetical protein
MNHLAKDIMLCAAETDPNRSWDERFVSIQAAHRIYRARVNLAQIGVDENGKFGEYTQVDWEGESSLGK